MKNISVLLNKRSAGDAVKSMAILYRWPSNAACVLNKMRDCLDERLILGLNRKP